MIQLVGGYLNNRRVPRSEFDDNGEYRVVITQQPTDATCIFEANVPLPHYFYQKLFIYKLRVNHSGIEVGEWTG